MSLLYKQNGSQAIREVDKLVGSASGMVKEALGNVLHAAEGFLVLELFEKY